MKVGRWKKKACWITLAGVSMFLLFSYHPIIYSPFSTAYHFGNYNKRWINGTTDSTRHKSNGHQLTNGTDNTLMTIKRNASTASPSDKREVLDVPFAVCKDAQFTKYRAYPLIALTSVPGSGNTWVRYLIERASGFYTGSVYRDKALFDGGFRGEMTSKLSRKTLTVKTHDTGSSSTTKMYEGAIVIIRNPYDTLLAYANLVHAGHVGRASEEYFNSEKWDSFVQSASISWEDRITTWVTRKNVMIVFYELLKSDLRHQIVSILNFLKVPISEERLDCMEAHPEGEFHRPKSETNRTLDPYKEKHRLIIEKHIRSASKVLRETGHIDYELEYSGVTKKV